MKKLIALLLALVMVLSLAACAKDDADDDDEKEEKTEQTAKPEKEDKEDKDDEDEDKDAEASELDLDDDCIAYAEDYADFLEALPEMDTAKFMRFAAPAMEYKDFTELIQGFYDMGVYTEEQFLSEMTVTEASKMLTDDYGDDYRVETVVQEAAALTSTQMSDLEDSIAEIRAGYEKLAASGDGATEADWEAMAAEDGVSVETEKRLIELCGLIAEELGDLKVTEGYQLTIQNTVTSDSIDEPSERIGQITVIKVNGEWMLLDGLIAYSVIHT